MRKKVKKIETNVYIKSSILGSVFMLLLGILLTLESDTTIISISYILGSILVLLGGYAILMFFTKKTNEMINQLFIVYGLIAAILGILIITNPKFIGSIIPFVVGIEFIIKSITKLKYAFELKEDKNKYWISTILFSIITAICGVVLIFNPFTASTIAVQVLGIIIIVYSVVDIISSILLKKKNKKNKKDFIKEADIVEESSVKDE